MIGIKTLLQKFRGNKAWLPLAALLICVGLAVGYFINAANSSDESNQTQVIQPVLKPNVTLSQPARVLVLPKPEVSDSDVLESVEQAKINSVSTEETVERVENFNRTTAKAEKIEKPKSSPLQNEISRPVIVIQPRRRSEPENPTRPRVVVSEPVPDIETIFTGRSSNARNERVRYEGEDRRRGKMSQEEWKEMRRERKQERKQRRNGKPFPF